MTKETKTLRLIKKGPIVNRVNSLVVGFRKGALVIAQQISSLPNRKSIFGCHCDCGAYCEKTASAILVSKSPSCGCVAKRLVSQARMGHGFSIANGEAEKGTYLAWLSMGWRCNNPARKDFKLYGGRGIVVCDSWKRFENFLNDMGLRPSRTHSIDRIDVNGNYEPGNCRWATIKEQANNKTTNRFITVDGVKRTFAQWAEALGCDGSVIRKRLAAGWSEERAATEPPANVGKKRKTQPITGKGC